MATYTQLTLEQAQEVGSTFGLDVEEVTGVPAGSVNSNYRLKLADGTPIFARVYEEQDRAGAEGEARLLDHLARHGVSTPRPLPRKDGTGFTFRLEVPASGELGSERAMALFPWRGGEILCQSRVTPEIAHLVGEKLAETHRAGSSFPEPRPGRFRVSDLRVRLQRIDTAEDPELRAMADPIRAALDRAERARDPDLSHGIIHGDLFRDNILWESGRLVALLDFESACDGSWVYDLMVTVLAWCYGSDLDESLARAMFRGYAGVRRLSRPELSALGTEGRIAALRFTVTRITDFAMRTGLGERVTKDYRRFWARHERIVSLGDTLPRWFE
jgi:homoserine kinase type II